MMSREAMFFYWVVGSALGLCVMVLIVEWIKERMRR